jgi:hypothetical protein
VGGARGVRDVGAAVADRATRPRPAGDHRSATHGPLAGRQAAHQVFSTGVDVDGAVVAEVRRTAWRPAAVSAGACAAAAGSPAGARCGAARPSAATRPSRSSSATSSGFSRLRFTTTRTQRRPPAKFVRFAIRLRDGRSARTGARRQLITNRRNNTRVHHELWSCRIWVTAVGNYDATPAKWRIDRRSHTGKGLGAASTGLYGVQAATGEARCVNCRQESERIHSRVAETPVPGLTRVPELMFSAGRLDLRHVFSDRESGISPVRRRCPVRSGRPWSALG